MSLLDWALDGLLALLLLWLAWRALASPELFRAVVLFIAFGLVLALVWARLYAVDVALAEMAIGAGVTGALLLAALVRLEPPIGRGRQDARDGEVYDHD
nr:DUF4040 domain-containing protein [uncultured Thiohalocapsa sp.]